MRVRKEAFDIQTLSEQLGMTTTAVAAPSPDAFAASPHASFARPRPLPPSRRPRAAFGAPPPPAPPAEGAPPPWAHPPRPRRPRSHRRASRREADGPFGCGYLWVGRRSPPMNAADHARAVANRILAEGRFLNRPCPGHSPASCAG